MNAPIRRVLPTPVAKEKQSDGNALSKSFTDGNSLWIISKICFVSAPFVRFQISKTLSRIFRLSLCGSRRLRRFAIVFTS